MKRLLMRGKTSGKQRFIFLTNGGLVLAAFALYALAAFGTMDVGTWP